MTQFADHEAVKELGELTYTMWNMGWDEKNGGNISYILSDEEVSEIDFSDELVFIELENIPSNLIGKHIMITASGSNFRLVRENISETVGIIKVEKNGYSILAGFQNGNKPTSEIYMHLLSHSARLEVDPTHRVIVHNHATEISEMTFVHELDDDSFTRTLWGLITECIVVFPDGIGVLPWMVCGNEAIGLATAEKLKDCRIVVWAHHGILASGSSLNDAFGLIETVNKAAKIYMATFDKRITTGITNPELLELCKFFNIVPKEGIIKN
ncbi:rhamnulose-1-phosphate aldolase [uncultured Trichococcus sp.]|uniref:rhamnulose-1-phosphate aldolase n=1 Tax=uncultured Trichococcus sp. TaxID=189665 RepID=UPI002A18D35A|nr:rhamnulose-1-phosphate aldolase [uncultured Trichococcus sp.]